MQRRNGRSGSHSRNGASWHRAELAEQIKTLEKAASGTKAREISRLVLVAKHVETGKYPAGTVPDYREDKSRLSRSFVDARRDGGHLCN